MKIKFKPYPKPDPAPRKTGPLSRPAPKPPTVEPALKKKNAPLRLRSQPGYVRRIFTLTHGSYSILLKCLRERHLGMDNYDDALQLILREWKQMKDQQHHPVLIAVPSDLLSPQDPSREQE